MKQKIWFVVVLGVAVAALVYGEHRKAEVAVSSEPLFHMLGDTQEELMRLPMEVTRISDEQEIRIGNQMAQQYLRVWVTDETKKDATYREAQAYVQEVGMRVASHARRKLPWKFHYIPDDSFVNAFALPGGHIFIGQGLINLMDSEDELAAVLGHEVEHVDLGHCAERVQVEARLRSLHLGDLAGLVGIPYQIFAAGYSKEQELAADRDGTRLEVEAGYSPTGAMRMFETFAQFEPGHPKARNPGEEISEVALSSLQEYFRTHPASDERAAQIRQMIAANHWTARQERELKIAYIGITSSAWTALNRYKYPEAAARAARSLKIRPGQGQALDVLYASSMYMGDFRQAAETARRSLELSPNSIERARHYATALAANSPTMESVRQFEAWRKVLGETAMFDSAQLNVEAAGLRLMAGDTKDADGLAESLANTTASEVTVGAQLTARQTGELLQRMGWWYYRAGKYDKALTYLGDAEQLYPNALGIDSQIGWAALQSMKLATAQSRFQAAAGPQESSVGLAVTDWRMGAKDDAKRVAGGFKDDPKWTNKRWVSAMYGKTVWTALMEMRKSGRHQVLGVGY